MIADWIYLILYDNNFSQDYYGIGNTTPELDSKQSYDLVSGKESNGITSIVFKRKWDTGDDEKDANLEVINKVADINNWIVI